MKRVAGMFSNPVWLFCLVVGGIVFWAQAENKASESTPRYRAPHPANCNGCKVANLQKF